MHRALNRTLVVLFNAFISLRLMNVLNIRTTEGVRISPFARRHAAHGQGWAPTPVASAATSIARVRSPEAIEASLLRTAQVQFKQEQVWSRMARCVCLGAFGPMTERCAPGHTGPCPRTRGGVPDFQTQHTRPCARKKEES